LSDIDRLKEEYETILTLKIEKDKENKVKKEELEFLNILRTYLKK